jgi:hypothetical protein
LSARSCRVRCCLISIRCKARSPRHEGNIGCVRELVDEGLDERLGRT